MRKLLPILFLNCLFLFTFELSYAQNGRNTLRLTISDSLTNEPIELATIGIRKTTEKEAFRYALSDKKGKVEIGTLEEGFFIIKIEHVSYNTKEISVKIESKVTELGLIKMNNSLMVMDDITVITEKPISVKGDTTIFNAKFFNPAPTDYLEDLIIKMPGLEIRDGRLFYNGKSVSDLTVEGKKFFSSDQLIALQNLPAYAIKNVSVLKKKNIRGGFSGSELGGNEENAPTQVDITLKDNMKTGWIGNILAGHDIEDKYKTKGLAGRFGQKAQYALVGEANNTSTSTGPTSFYNPKLMQNDVRSFKSPGFSGISNPGEIETTSLGADYSRNDISEKITSMLNGNYAYKRTNTDIFQSSNRETYLPEGILYSNRINQSSEINNSHNIHFSETFLHRKNDFSIEFAPNFAYNKGRSIQENSYSTKNEDHLLNDGISKNNGTNSNLSFAGNLQLSKYKIFGSGNLNANFTYSYQDVNLKSINTSNTSYYTGNSSIDSISNQQNSDLNKSFSLLSHFNYYDRYKLFNKKIGLHLFYKIRTEYNKSNKEAYYYNEITNKYDKIDSTGTGSIKNVFLEHSIGFKTDIGLGKKWEMNVGFEFLPSIIENKYNHEKTSKWDYNYAPYFRIFKRINTVSKLYLTYNGTSKQPTIEQLQPIVDKINPLNIKSGNPNLISEFTNKINFVYNISLFSELNLTSRIIQNKVIYKSTIDDIGVRHSIPVNENGNFDISLNYRYLSTPNRKLSFSNISSVSFFRNVGYTNSVKYFSKTLNISETISGNYRREYFYTTLGLGVSYSNSRYSIKTIDKKSNWTNSITNTINWSLPFKMNLISKFVYNFYIGYQYDNKPAAMWDIELSKQLFATKLVMSVKAYDVLNQTKNLKIVYGEDYMEEQINNSLGRYFMINLIWKFGKFGN